jgi:hypothetical protein
MNTASPAHLSNRRERERKEVKAGGTPGSAVSMALLSILQPIIEVYFEVFSQKTEENEKKEVKEDVALSSSSELHGFYFSLRFLSFFNCWDFSGKILI